MQTSPPTVRSAVALWGIAVAAGIVETMLAVSSIVRSGPVEPSLWLNIGFRSVVFTVAALLIVQFAAGRNWARIALTIMLSTLGLASMVIPIALSMLDGGGFAQAVAGDLGTLFLLVRVAHMVTVVAATVLMYVPSANLFFAEERNPEKQAARADRTATIRTS